jgi:hypothetical protein
MSLGMLVMALSVKENTSSNISNKSQELVSKILVEFILRHYYHNYNYY